jgi:hypothetical protein
MRLDEMANLYVWWVGKIKLLHSPVPPCGAVDLFGRVAGHHLLAYLLAAHRASPASH